MLHCARLFLTQVKVPSCRAYTMDAIVAPHPGPPDVFRIESRPVPVPAAGQVLLKVLAIGLNRSEMFTRQGYSPGVQFPRVLGIEAAGVVMEAPGKEFEKGVTAVTCMGGMGRAYDGGYAEYTCVPASQVRQIDASRIPVHIWGGLTEMMQTAWGSLFSALKIQRGERLLIRGGTASIGLAAASIAKHQGCHVTSTSRQADRGALLKEYGADDILIDDGKLSKQDGLVKFDKVLELVGTNTLSDSLRVTKSGGIVCNTGIAGGSWYLEKLNPMDFIPSTVCLTAYSGGVEDFMSMPLDELVADVRDGNIKIPIGRVLKFSEMAEAHRLMESGDAGGKLVILTDAGAKTAASEQD